MQQIQGRSINQGVPVNQFQQNNAFPRNPIRRTNWFLYLLAIFLSIAFTIIPLFLLFLAHFFVISNQIIIYFWTIIMVGAMSLMSGLVFLKVSKTRKRYITGTVVAGVVSAIVVSIVLYLLTKVSNAMIEALNVFAKPEGSVSMGIMSMISPMGANPILEGILVLAVFIGVTMLVLSKVDNDLE